MNFLYKLVIAIALDACLFVLALFLWGIATYNYKYDYDAVNKIFHKLIVETGQTQDAPYLQIIESPQINAFTDGKRVVVYRGMLDFVKNDDELALVLGHEIAHDMLRHTYYRDFQSSDLEISVAEANADKLGALYILKAGYDVCTAREMWKRMRDEEGNYQGFDHPTFSYRFAELNVQCE